MSHALKNSKMQKRLSRGSKLVTKKKKVPLRNENIVTKHKIKTLENKLHKKKNCKKKSNFFSRPNFVGCLVEHIPDRLWSLKKKYFFTKKKFPLKLHRWIAFLKCCSTVKFQPNPFLTKKKFVRQTSARSPVWNRSEWGHLGGWFQFRHFWC